MVSKTLLIEAKKPRVVLSTRHDFPPVRFNKLKSEYKSKLVDTSEEEDEEDNENDKNENDNDNEKMEMVEK